MATKEYLTGYPANQDPDPITINQPDLINESAPDAGDGDQARASQIMANRDKLHAVCKKVGDDSNLPAGCHAAKIATLEASAPYVPIAQKGAASGVATLDGGGKIPSAQIPAVALPEMHVVADAAARIALTVEEGDEAKQTDNGKHYIYDGSTWYEYPTGVAADQLVKVTTNDTTSGYLDSKVAVTNGLTKSTLNPSGNEQIQLEPTYGAAANTVCEGDDSRLSNSRAPTGSAGGQLSGTYPNPDVAGIQTTTGPTNLGIGAIADGEFLKRSSTSIVGVAFGSASGTICEGDDSRLSDDRTADGIRTATTIVSVSGATAPTTGQILKATSGSVATWQDEAAGGVDRNLVFSDYFEKAETSSSYVTKKFFPIVRDSAKAPIAWRLVVSLWITGGGTSADCRLQGVGSGGTDSNTVSSTEVTETASSIKKIALTINGTNEPTDELLTINIQLQATGGGTAHLKYTDLYAIY